MKKATEIVLICLFVKLILGAALPMFFDETYYWFWGHHLQTSYFDHPPFISWLFALGKIFDNFGQASRWPSIILSQLSVFVWLKILEKQLSDAKLLAFAVLMSLWPLFGFISVVATPDIPLIFFWSLSILFFQRSLENASWQNYLFLGLSLGLGGSSKYQIALIIPCYIIYLSLSKSWNKIDIKKLPLTILMGLIACSPVFIWNYQNNWDSILFQIDHGLGSPKWKYIWTLDYIWTQSLIIFPPVLFLALRNFKQNLFFHSFAWFPVLFFLFSSTKGRVEANWPIMAYPSIAALAILSSQSFRWLKWSAAFWATISIAVASNLFYYWLPVPIENTKLYETEEFKPLAVISRSYQPIYASSFQMASYLSYLNKSDVCKLRDYHRKDFYDYLDCSIPTEKRYYFLVSGSFKQLPDWAKDHQIINEIQITQDYKLLEIEQP